MEEGVIQISDKAASTVIESIRNLAAAFDLKVVPREAALAEGVENSPAIPPTAARLQTATAWLRAAKLRAEALGRDLASDPAWEMLLDLYVHETQGNQVSVKGACVAAHVPATTALRWLAVIEAKGWVVRADDPFDGRRVLLGLTDMARAKIEWALDAVVDSDRRLGLARMSVGERIDRGLHVTENR